MPGPDDQRKRRLPLLQPGEGNGDGEGDRPAWHAAVWGALATMLALLPLAALAQLGVRRVLDSRLPAGSDPLVTAVAFDALAPGDRLFVRVVMAAVPLAALALAALLGALLVARWGGGGGKRQGALGGALAGLVAAAMGASAYLQHGEVLTWLLTSLVIVTVAALAALGGTTLGQRLRRRGR